jgi:cobyrinic acid a,c-diamide synthase
MPGLILSAPASGSGKTVITLGILRALWRRGVAVRGAKSGPDYIDPRFHAAASGREAMTLDAWAMTPARIAALAAGDGMLLVEGAMGLFDGAPPAGRGATADLARMLGLPVVLIVDAARMAQSVAPLVAGFARHDPSVRVVGVILNRVGSPRHRVMLEAALAPLDLPVLGAVPRDAGLALPERHLGLVQAGEHPDLEGFLDRAADVMEAALDLDALVRLATPLVEAASWTPPAAPKRIALARDAAFAFVYPHVLADWQAAGATILPFSPLADETVPEAEFVYLPGGYPELHAGRIARAKNFIQSLRYASQSIDIYGECGGYMVLGQSLTDAAGEVHRMAGLLPLATSFAARKLHLGYRHLRGGAGPLTGSFLAHEFHYATTVRAEGTPLFDATDAEGQPLPPMGLRQGRVAGSFAHIIDRAAPAPLATGEPES